MLPDVDDDDEEDEEEEEDEEDEEEEAEEDETDAIELTEGRRTMLDRWLLMLGTTDVLVLLSNELETERPVVPQMSSFLSELSIV